MKTFKEVIAEEKEINEAFRDSGAATDFMYGVAHKMGDRNLMAWAKETDSNMGYKTVPLLKKAIQAYDKFLAEMEKE